MLLAVIADYLHCASVHRDDFAVRPYHPVSREGRERLSTVKSENESLYGCPHDPICTAVYPDTLGKTFDGLGRSNGFPLCRTAALKIVHFNGIVRMENHHVIFPVPGKIIDIRSQKHRLLQIHRERIHETAEPVDQVEFRTGCKKYLELAVGKIIDCAGASANRRLERGAPDAFAVLFLCEMVIATIGSAATASWIVLGVLIQKFYRKHYRAVNIGLALTLLECIYSMLR